MAIACVITFNEATYSLPRALQQSTSTIVGYLNATKQVRATYVIYDELICTHALTTEY